MIVETNWYPEHKLIHSTLSGNVDVGDVIKWETGLHDALSKIKDNARFKIFINLFGFKAVNLEVHKRFRTVVPLTLASYGWKVGYVDLFEEEAKSLVLSNNRGIQCFGAAHCHQDETKIQLYQSKYSRENEHLFY